MRIAALLLVVLGVAGCEAILGAPFGVYSLSTDGGTVADAGDELDAGDAGRVDAGHVDAGDAGELDAGHLDAGDAGDDAGEPDAGDAGGLELVLACGGTASACPPDTGGGQQVSSPTVCGGSGCQAPALAVVCAVHLVHSVRFNCDLTTCESGGFALLESYASCDCPSGFLYVCAP